MPLKKLREPFAENEVNWRISRSGHKNGSPYAVVVPYIDARAVQHRLDEVLGPENWQTRLVPCNRGMVRELSIRCGTEWITKADGAEETDYEPVKGACSKSLVRVAVLWGIGRYLYDTPTSFARFVDKDVRGSQYAEIDGKEYHWIPNTSTLPAEPAPPVPSAIPKAVGATSTHTAPSTVVKAIERAPVIPANGPGDAVVPFGATQGTKLKDLKPSDIVGLEEFYQRVPSPHGKAKTFKLIFEAFLVSIRWEKKNA